MASLKQAVDRFNQKVAKYVENVPPQKLLLLQRKLVLEALRRIVLKTPVDTGRARGNWQVTIASPGKGFKKTGFDKGGGPTIEAGIQALNGLGVYQIVYITNNVPYIIYLEHGTSKQAPAGMVRVTVEELLQMFPK